MKSIPFVKMQGIGNDYIYIDAIKHRIPSPGSLAKKMSDRHYGIGSDGLILILKSKTADFQMRMFNSDGTESEMCGNGIRCFAKFLYDGRYTKKKVITVETKAGIKILTLAVSKGKVSAVTVDMGAPIQERSRIPMTGPSGSVINEQLVLDDSVEFTITSVSMGNPHVVIFADDIDNFPVEKYGPLIEHHTSFPNRTNVEFIEVISRREIRQRTWERGAGETLACGTGASAAVTAGILTGKLDRSVKVKLRGGDLQIRWDQKTGHIFMTGPAVTVFTGEWKL